MAPWFKNPHQSCMFATHLPQRIFKKKEIILIDQLSHFLHQFERPKVLVLVSCICMSSEEYKLTHADALCVSLSIAQLFCAVLLSMTPMLNYILITIILQLLYMKYGCIYSYSSWKGIRIGYFPKTHCGSLATAL